MSAQENEVVTTTPQTFEPVIWLTVEYIAENLLFCSRDKVEDLLVFAPDLSPEQTADVLQKIQKTYIGREVRIHPRAYQAWSDLNQGKQVETKRMSGKAKVTLAKAKK